MGKGGVILGLIGILLGAGGLGFGFIIWNTQNTIQTQLTQFTPQDTWYRYYEDIYDVDTINTYLTIPNMSLSIDLSKITSIHLLFTCQAYTIGRVGRSDVMIYFYIDEIIISNPNARVGTYDGDPTTYYHSVSLQYFIEGWSVGTHNISMFVRSVGTHNISMFVRSTVDTNFLQYCALTVQSLPV